MSKSSKSFLAALVAALMFLPLKMPAQQGSANPQAQGDAQSAQAHQQQLRRLAVLGQYLNLTDDQKRQWVQIQKETAQSVRAARRDESLNEEQMQQKIKEIHAGQKRQLLALLTPQQQEALKKWWDEQKQKQDKNPDAVSGAGASATAGAKDDDFFAGMVQDPDPAPAPATAQNKKVLPKN